MLTFKLKRSAELEESERYPQTPDGRYFVVRGRLWRRSDPSLPADERARLVSTLMAARRTVGRARTDGDRDTLREARAAVDQAKRDLGERGPVWWTDDAPDFGRHLVKNTPYADWYKVFDELPKSRPL